MIVAYVLKRFLELLDFRVGVLPSFFKTDLLLLLGGQILHCFSRGYFDFLGDVQYNVQQPHEY